MNQKQKKYSIISLILIILALIIPIVAAFAAASGIGDIEPAPDSTPDGGQLPGAEIIGAVFVGLAAVLYMIICIVIGCSVSGILGYSAYSLSSKAMQFTPEGEAIPLFPRVLRVIAAAETVLAVVGLIAGCALMTSV